MSRAASVDEVLDLLETWGDRTYDEDITQLDHGLQCAALASAEGAGEALVVAALLHDVGHLLALRDGTPEDGQVDEDLRHEARGARWLAGLYPAAVTGPIALHVAAKRYRCAVDPAYRAGLSRGSERSLVRQGGPMDADEVARFEANPGHRAAVALRGWDDSGKVEELVVPPLSAYDDVLRRVATPT